MPNITIRDLALYRGAQEQDGGITGAEFERVGLAILGGCALCGATLGAHNAYPSTSGQWLCRICLPLVGGWTSVEQANADIFGETP